MTRLLPLLLACLPLLAAADEPEVRVQNRLVPASGAFVGGTVNLEVDLLVDTWFTAAPVLPKLALQDALVSQPSGEATHLTEPLGGKTFFGLRFTYQITPQVARRFDIPALEFQVQAGQASGGPVKVRGQPLAFVARQPGGAAGEPRLVAQSVTLTQEIQRSHEPLRVGDSITRRLTLKAEGAQAMLIRPPEFVEVTGMKRYVQTPRVKPLGDGRGGIAGGMREDAATYVIAESGRLALPAIELKWWDAATGEARSVSVPAVAFEAAEGAYQAPFSITEDLRALGQKTRVRISGNWLLLAVSLLLGGGLAYFGRPWGRALLGALRQWREARYKARLASPGHAWKLARQQLAARPAQLGGLYLWVRRSTGDWTLAAFSRALPDAIADRLLAFLKARYGRGGEAQAPAALAECLPEARRALAERNKVSPTGQGLKPLNP
ncbi:hypothetical protein D3C78_263530 [compost metagenome]